MPKSFSMKFQALKPLMFLKSDCSKGVFTGILENFKNTYLRTAAFESVRY